MWFRKSERDAAGPGRKLGQLLVHTVRYRRERGLLEARAKEKDVQRKEGRDNVGCHKRFQVFREMLQRYVCVAGLLNPSTESPTPCLTGLHLRRSNSAPLKKRCTDTRRANALACARVWSVH